MKTPEKDYYSILEIDKNAATDEIRKAYLKLVKKYHPDSQNSGDENSTEKFQSVLEAYRALNDSKLRSEYDQNFFGYQRAEKRMARKDEKDENVKHRAERFYNKGIEDLKDGDYNRAIEYLQIAANLAPSNPLYLSTLGIAFSKKKRRLHEARDWCEKAVTIDPYNPTYYVNLATVYKEAGLHKMANKYFDQALRLDPENKRAIKGIGISKEGDGLKERLRGLMLKAFRKKEK